MAICTDEIISADGGQLIPILVQDPPGTGPAWYLFLFAGTVFDDLLGASLEVRALPLYEHFRPRGWGGARFQQFRVVSASAPAFQTGDYTRETRLPMSQSFTFIDVAGNQAQYTVHRNDRQDDFGWSTDHGDHGVAPSFDQAQYRARIVLKDSMAANRRSDELTEMPKYSFRRR